MMTTKRFFLLAAIVCFIIALFMAIIDDFGDIQDQNSLMIGGLLALALSFYDYPENWHT